MKPLHFKIPKTSGESVRVLDEKHPHLYDNLHFHPEIQLMIILESTGTRFIGDSVGNFSDGDVILLGSNLPHVFRNDKKYYEQDPNLQSHNISIFFDADAIGEKFFSLPEVYPIQQLLQNCRKGINVKGKTKDKVIELALQIRSMEGFERLLQVFTILKVLASSKDLETISSFGFNGLQKDIDSKKINDVFNYIMNNFSDEIRLQEAADVANMSTNAFCRYFKQHTRKTFSRFLNEVRIGHACQLLQEDKWNIRETAFECGYDNISYFNRQFKEITGFTPSAYVKKHRNSFSMLDS